MDYLTAKIKDDFDEIALFERTGDWNHNNHYHSFILKKINPNAERVLEVGCGSGEFSRFASEKAREVIGIDFSQNMILKAIDLSKDLSNISYLSEDYFQLKFPKNHFDTIVSIATAHHFSLPQFLEKAKQELKQGGKIIILDLFEEENSLMDKINDLVALPISNSLKFWHNGFVKASPEEQKAWEEHGKTDEYLTLDELQKIAQEKVPNAKIKRHLFWRYSLIWQK